MYKCKPIDDAQTCDRVAVYYVWYLGISLPISSCTEHVRDRLASMPSPDWTVAQIRLLPEVHEKLLTAEKARRRTAWAEKDQKNQERTPPIAEEEEDG